MMADKKSKTTAMKTPETGASKKGAKTPAKTPVKKAKEPAAQTKTIKAAAKPVAKATAKPAAKGSKAPAKAVAPSPKKAVKKPAARPAQKAVKSTKTQSHSAQKAAKTAPKGRDFSAALDEAMLAQEAGQEAPKAKARLTILTSFLRRPFLGLQDFSGTPLNRALDARSFRSLTLILLLHSIMAGIIAVLGVLIAGFFLGKWAYKVPDSWSASFDVVMMFVGFLCVLAAMFWLLVVTWYGFKMLIWRMHYFGLKAWWLLPIILLLAYQQFFAESFAFNLEESMQRGTFGESVNKGYLFSMICISMAVGAVMSLVSYILYFHRGNQSGTWALLPTQQHHRIFYGAAFVVAGLSLISQIVGIFNPLILYFAVAWHM